MFDNTKKRIITQNAMIENVTNEKPDESIDCVWMSTPNKFCTSVTPGMIDLILNVGRKIKYTRQAKNVL